KVKGPERAREYYEIITREAERLTRLIDNVLDFARLEQGRAAYDFREGNLGELMDRALEIYRHRAEREGVKLVTRIEPDLPRSAFDEEAMTLVLLNLLDNALKYGIASAVPGAPGALGASVSTPSDAPTPEVVISLRTVHRDDRKG